MILWTLRFKRRKIECMQQMFLFGGRKRRRGEKARTARFRLQTKPTNQLLQAISTEEASTEVGCKLILPAAAAGNTRLCPESCGAYVCVPAWLDGPLENAVEIEQV